MGIQWVTVAFTILPHCLWKAISVYGYSVWAGNMNFHSAFVAISSFLEGCGSTW